MVTVTERMRDAAAPVLRRQSQWLTEVFVRHYLRGYLRGHFHAVRLSGPPPDDPRPERPLVVFSNHPSWWDPLICLLMGRKALPRRRGFGPMDAAMLEKYAFMKRLGLYGVEQSTLRGAAQFLTVSKGILMQPGAMIWLTPQGEFTDARARPLRFRPGLAHLARDLEDAVLLPAALEYPFWNESKPEALVRFGPAIESGPARGRTAPEWDALLADALARTMDELATDAQTRDARRFRTLISGQTGVGFIYDSWRRFKALATGRGFSAAHEDEIRGGRT